MSPGTSARLPANSISASTRVFAALLDRTCDEQWPSPVDRRVRGGLGTDHWKGWSSYETQNDKVPVGELDHSRVMPWAHCVFATPSRPERCVKYICARVRDRQLKLDWATRFLGRTIARTARTASSRHCNPSRHRACGQSTRDPPSAASNLYSRRGPADLDFYYWFPIDENQQGRGFVCRDAD